MTCGTASPSARLKLASTYLGHASMAHTYWYLEATPVLMHSIAAAGEHLFAEGRA